MVSNPSTSPGLSSINERNIVNVDTLDIIRSISNQVHTWVITFMGWPSQMIDIYILYFDINFVNWCTWILVIRIYATIEYCNLLVGYLCWSDCQCNLAILCHSDTETKRCLRLGWIVSKVNYSWHNYFHCIPSPIVITRIDDIIITLIFISHFCNGTATTHVLARSSHVSVELCLETRPKYTKYIPDTCTGGIWD